MELQPVIRTATADDVSRLLKLATGFRADLGRSRPSDGELRESIRALLADGAAEFFVALGDNGDGLEFIQQRYRYSMWVSGLEACIEDLFVSPESRHNDIGFRLVEYAVARAQGKGCHSITVDTNELNEPAILLYRRLGFSCESSRFADGKQLWFERSLEVSCG